METVGRIRVRENKDGLLVLKRVAKSPPGGGLVRRAVGASFIHIGWQVGEARTQRKMYEGCI